MADRDQESRPLHRLFEPVSIGGLRLRNRLMMTTHGPRLPEDRYLRYLDVRSRDVALVGVHAAWGLSSFPPGPGTFRPGDVLEPDSVAPNPLTPAGRAYCERYVAVLEQQAAVVHANGALCVGQLHHPGASDHGDVLRAVVGAGPVADEFRRRVPHVLTGGEIAALVQVFAETAGRVMRAGLDAVEIHAAHGYLLNQFLSPITNTRTDRYGGSFDGRLQMLLDVVAAVRGAVGPAFPIGVRIPGSEAADGGLTTAGMCRVAARLEAAGVAYLNVSNGTYTGLRRGLGVAYVAPASVPAGPAVPDAAAIRGAVHIPVAVAGRVVDPAVAEQIVQDGSADVVGFTRALIADPRFFAKVRNGAAARIDACIGCNECHTGIQVRCTVNPAAGREDELDARPAERPARLLVVGGGPAGLQFARVAAGRGHHVTLVEQAEALGGALCALGADPARPELEAFRRHLAAAVLEAGVDVRLGTTATPELVAGLAPDRVIVATGSEEYVPVLDGPADPVRVTTGLAALRGAVAPGARVAVVGGLDDHLPPLVVATALATAGHEVTLLTQQLVEGEAVEVATRLEYIRRLRHQGVTVRRLTAVEALLPAGLVVRDTLTNERSEIHGVDTVVFVCGRRARTELADRLRETDRPAIDLIGDCVAPRRLVHATMDATRHAVTV